MTVDELRRAAKGDGEIVFVVPCINAKPPSRLFGRAGPRVEVVCVNAMGNAVVSVDKAALRRWLKNNTEGF